MNSIKWNFANSPPFLMDSQTFLAFPRPCATATFISLPLSFIVATFMPSSVSSSSHSSFCNVLPVINSYAVLRAASITPPVLPNMAAAPVYFPSNVSGPSSGSLVMSIPAILSSFANSLVVITMSTSGNFGVSSGMCPFSFNHSQALHISSLALSNFLAVHGIIETTTTFLGSIPSFNAA